MFFEVIVENLVLLFCIDGRNFKLLDGSFLLLEKYLFDVLQPIDLLVL